VRQINKGAEPASLTAHRLTPHCDYDNYADMETLRHALVNEQRGICCYCMSRIRNGPTSMKVEHWRSQSRHPNEQLSYRNLLGACLGGHGQPPHLQHCDTRKGQCDLQWNPADAAHRIETRVRYELDGSIHADDGAFNSQIDQVLNLNLSLHKNNRKGILDAVLEWWKREKARIGGPVPRERFERERNKHLAGDGQIPPYSPVAVWWLGQKLARMTA
jgi:uncharacterized protein (TIGR02646 family)